MNCQRPPSYNWVLVHEFGVAGISDQTPSLDLHYPSYASKGDDGTYWIVDEYGTEKLVPFRFESRVIGVNAGGEVCFDSRSLGIDDGFGCLIDDGQLAILRRTQWELVILSRQGKIADQISLSTMSKRMPRDVSWTSRGTFLIVFCNRVGEVEIIEVDRQGRLLWFLAPDASEIGIAASVELLSDDTLLIADPFRHRVVELDRTGNVVWQYGVAGDPSDAHGRLSSPSSARTMPDGRRLIADMRNHRVLMIADDGAAERLESVSERFCDPVYATRLDSGTYLVCDTGNRRVVEMDCEGRVVRQLGYTPPRHRYFSYPRSVEPVDDQTFVVADTAQDRIVEVSVNGIRACSAQLDPPLFWPRCARPLPSGGLLIADGRNGRVVELAVDGQLVNQLSEIDLKGRTSLRDPHDVQLLPNGHVLIADSAQNLVVETDWTGRVYRVVGDSETLSLRDPHSAQWIADGSLVIADTGNHRILIVGSDSANVQSIQTIFGESCCYRLNFPRHVEIVDNETMVIADTGNNRVLAATREGQFLWEFSVVPGGSPARLNQPRWARMINAHELLVCDHLHHRVLHVRWSGKGSPSGDAAAVHTTSPAWPD